MKKMICFLVFFVSSFALSHSSICESPGVLRTSDGIGICKYNLQGELTYQSVPCPANTEYSDSSNRCEVLKRERRDASESDSSESKESTESDSDEGINAVDIGPLVSESPNDLTTAGQTSSDQTKSSTGQTGSEEPTENTSSAVDPSGQTSEGTTGQTASGSTVPTDQTSLGTTDQTTPGSTGQSTEQTISDSTDQPTELTTVSTTTVTDPPGPVEPPTCRFAGVMCTSCTEGVWCVGTGTMKDGIPFITPVLDVKCNQGEICQDFRGCVSDETNLCSISDFTCTDDGMFPDPYDCTVFHSCVSIDGKFIQNDIKCAFGAYDAKTGTCGYPINTPNCLNRPVPHCTAQFEMGALPTNPSIYYICIKKGKTISPSLFRCPGGTKFTTALFSCV